MGTSTEVFIFFYCNTILTDLTEWSNYGKLRTAMERENGVIQKLLHICIETKLN